MANRISTCLLKAVTLGTLLIGSAQAEVANSSLEWLAGHWCVEMGGDTVEEFWLPPHGGVMAGLARTLSTERTTGFEFLRIAQIDGVQSYIAQPGGRPPTSFRRTAGGERWVRFENPDHDFPQRIEYRREGEDLHAEVAGPGKNGEESVLNFDYSPCRSQPLASEDTDAIRTARAESNRAIARHDVEGIVSFLDVEYVITTGSGVIEGGRDGADESWAQHFVEFPDVVYVRTPSEVTLSSSNPLAVEHGNWVGTRTTPNGVQEKGGQYTASWRKVDGAWKIRSELFVTLY